MNPVRPSRSRGKSIPLILVITSSLILAGALFWFSHSPTSVIANTPDRDLLLATYPILGSRIAPTAGGACAVCHASSIPNLNPYGSAYSNAGRFNASSLIAIENIDSDGDGFTNIQELRAFTYPGDPNDHPAPPTATSLPPTATRVPPTATNVPPTATRVPPTGTNVPPTATNVPPTATRTATATTAPSSTSAPSATSIPTQGPAPTQAATATTGPTATRVASATRAPTNVVRTATARPTLRVSPTPTCLRDDDKTSKSRENGENRGTRNRCPRGFHEDQRELEKETMVARLREIYARSESSKNH